MTREAEKAAFLQRAGWDQAVCAFLAGDASDRSYDRLWLGPHRAVLMDAPPGKGDDTQVFITIAAHLRSLGLSAPRVIAQDLIAGFLLLEDLGDDLFARVVATDPGQQTMVYAAATDVLVHLQAHPMPQDLPDLTAVEWAEAAGFAVDWYGFAVTGTRADRTPLVEAMAKVLSRHADGPRVMILRDYHAENLLWLPDRQGLAQVGLLDFQFAQGGQPGYDLVSLLQDARRDVPPEIEARMIARFSLATDADPQDFRLGYAALGAQRALRILGVFAKLCLVGGKPGYLSHMPRVWDQLHRNLAAPGLEELARACARLPPPTAAAMERIGAQCCSFR